MIGAIVGDIAGSPYEFCNHKSKDFPLFSPKGSFTDDSVMSLAVCDALLRCIDDYGHLSETAVRSMQEIGRQYPYCGYGAMFAGWLFSDDPRPYNSFGNGAAMRVSGCGYAARSLEEAKVFAKAVTEVTHNHPEALKAAEAVAVAVYLARTGSSKEVIRQHITENYYPIDFTIDSLRPHYGWDVTCQGSVPQAFEAFFESTGFEDAVRTAISLGGDSDTIGAITGSMAGAYYGVPEKIKNEALSYLDPQLTGILIEFEEEFCC